jgi:hypothetical protein
VEKARSEGTLFAVQLSSLSASLARIGASNRCTTISYGIRWRIKTHCTVPKHLRIVCMLPTGLCDIKITALR